MSLWLRLDASNAKKAWLTQRCCLEHTAADAAVHVQAVLCRDIEVMFFDLIVTTRDSQQRMVSLAG